MILKLLTIPALAAATVGAINVVSSDDTPTAQLEAVAGSETPVIARAEPQGTRNTPGRFAEGRREGAERWRERSRRAAEFRREGFEKIRAEFDVDGDGTISDEERAAARATMRARWEEKRARWAEQMTDRVLKLDTNEDGLISREEIMDRAQDRAAAKADRMFSKADTNGDGVIDLDEVAAIPERIEAQKQAFRESMVTRFDADGDGQLNDTERRTAKTTMRQEQRDKRFTRRHDANGDGVLNEVDMESFMQRLRDGDRRADINRDGTPDSADLKAFMDRLGELKQ